MMIAVRFVWLCLAKLAKLSFIGHWNVMGYGEGVVLPQMIIFANVLRGTCPFGGRREHTYPCIHSHIQ